MTSLTTILITTLLIGTAVGCPVSLLDLGCVCQEWLSGLHLDCAGRPLPDVLRALRDDGRSVRVLSLSNATNVTEGLTEDAFEGLEIKELDLSANNLTSLPPSLFAPLNSSLGHLRLANNSLAALPDLRLAALTNLDLRGNAIAAVPEAVFAGLPELTHLLLGGNQICELEKDSLAEVTSRLALLDLSDNCLSTVPARNLRGAPQLAFLDLSGNRIGPRLANLQFMNLPSLREVRLARNRITEVMPLAFMNVRSLGQLDLSHNAISVLAPNRFQGFPRLQILNLAHNHIKKLSTSAFKEMGELRQLLLDGNEIRSLETLAISACPRLQLVSLQGNGLAELFRNGFDDLPSLLTLLLANNSLQDLNPGLLSGMRNLQQLSLRNNRLTILRRGVMSALPALTSLDLALNGLRKVEPGALDGLQSLFWLDLSGNRLPGLGPGVLNAKIPNVVLHDNPLDCSPTRISPLVNYLVANNVRTFFPRQPTIVCAQPEGMRGTRLKDLMIQRANETLHTTPNYGLNSGVYPSATTSLPLTNLLPTLNMVPGVGGLGPIPGLAHSPAPSRGPSSYMPPTRNDIIAALPRLKGSLPRSLPGLPGFDLNSVPPQLIAQFLRGEAIAGVALPPHVRDRVTDDLVARLTPLVVALRRQDQAARSGLQAPPQEQELRPSQRPVAPTVQGFPQGFPPTQGPGIITAGTVQGPVQDAFPGQPSFPATAGSDPGSFGPQQPQIPNIGPVGVGRGASPKLPVAELLRVFSNDLGSLPPSLIQAIASNRPIDFSQVPPALMAKLRAKDPELAGRVEAALLASAADSPRQASYTAAPPRPLSERFPKTTPKGRRGGKTPLVFNLKDVTSDLVNPDDSSDPRLTMFTGIGLGVVGAFTFITMLFLCWKRKAANSGDSHNSEPPSNSSGHLIDLSAPVPHSGPALPPQPLNAPQLMHHQGSQGHHGDPYGLSGSFGYSEGPPMFGSMNRGYGGKHPPHPIFAAPPQLPNKR